MVQRVSVEDAAAMLGSTCEAVERLIGQGVLSRDENGIPIDELTRYLAEEDSLAGPQFDRS